VKAQAFASQRTLKQVFKRLQKLIEHLPAKFGDDRWNAIGVFFVFDGIIDA
jgi:hypothetical protein